MRYERNYLTQVVLRLDFPSIPALLAERQPALTERIRERFPTLKSTQAVQLLFNLGAEAQGGVTQSITGRIWQHGANDGFGKSVSLSHNFLALEYTAGQYSDATEFLDNFRFVHRAFADLYRIETASRIGLRYINEVKLDEGNALDWQGIIKPDFVAGVLAGVPPTMRMTRSMHQLTAAEDDVSLILNYGLHNPEFPNPLVRRNFVIDLDFSVAGDIRAGDLEPKVRDLNRRSEELFESIIDDQLRDRMGRINEQA